MFFLFIHFLLNAISSRQAILNPCLFSIAETKFEFYKNLQKNQYLAMHHLFQLNQHLIYFFCIYLIDQQFLTQFFEGFNFFVFSYIFVKKI